MVLKKKKKDVYLKHLENSQNNKIFFLLKIVNFEISCENIKTF